MRRTLATTTVVLATALSTALATVLAGALAGVPAAASPRTPVTPLTPVGSGAPGDPAAEVTLSKAVRLLDPVVRARTPAAELEHTTFVLRELFESLPELEGDDRVLAEQILARPTDGARDPRGYGYTTRSVKDCRRTVCLHWVKSTRDAPPSRAWAKKSLRVLQQVYRFEVNKLGYRRPVPDRRHGGNSKFDVYLKDLGTGLYGFCVPEYYKPGSRKVASGYCVIDNDFSRAQFNGSPGANLRVTLAHEFFHAVQFAYDFTDDPWIYESTAAWMEERFADSVDDNRQYLPVGQVRLSHIPLDTFAEPGFHYGNWVWWEYLSSRFGNRVVRDVWSRLDANKGRPDMYSTQGLRSVLRSRGGFTKVFAAYAGANNVPRRSYAEGRSWPSAIVSGSDRLGKRDRRAAFGTRLDHMSSRNYVVKPDRTMRGRWKLRVKINGPSRASSPAAYLIVRKKGGGIERRAIGLTRKGFGKRIVSFNRSRTRSVIVTVANTSTRFTCRRGTAYSCRGAARDDNRRFTVATKVFR